MKTGRPILERFVALEGIDGSGTTTQLSLLVSAAKDAGIPFSADAEPTGGPVGTLIRTSLRATEPLDPVTVAHLFAADRWQHVYGQGGVAERCAEGTLVASDRYLFSSLAYQHVACRNLEPRPGHPDPVAIVDALNAVFPLPRVVFFLRLPAAEALERVEKRGRSPDIYERLDFLEKTAAEYEAVFRGFEGSPCETLALDASESPEDVHRAIVSALRSRGIFG